MPVEAKDRLAPEPDFDEVASVVTLRTLRQPRLARALEASPKSVLVILDLCAVLAGATLAALVLAQSGDLGVPKNDERLFAVVLLAGAALHPLSFMHHRLYVARFITRSADEIRRIIYGTATGALAFVMMAFVLDVETSRAWVVLAFLFVSLLVIIERRLIRNVFRSMRLRGFAMRDVVIIGNNAEGHALRDMFARDASLGYRVAAIVDDRARQGPKDSPVEKTIDVVVRTRSSGVVIATSALDIASTNRLVRELTDAGVHVELSSSLFDIASHRLTVRPLGRFPVVYVEPVKRDGWRPKAKRAFDIVAASMLLVVTAPVLLMAAVLIKLDTPGPAIFRQQRIGRDGKPFAVLKLRTMVLDAEQRLKEVTHLNEADGPLFKIRDDPRITRVGRFLRKMSIDELPQLINVLRAEMSMVGPRPALPSEVDRWDDDLRSRLRVSPGITGMWQVSGRSDTTFEDYQRLDLYYVDNWSLVTDLAIVLRTVPAVLRRQGAH
jgi:exopolysaccharide biosynthesis polyprenyl glycosylphosphotransferase